MFARLIGRTSKDIHNGRMKRGQCNNRREKDEQVHMLRWFLIKFADLGVDFNLFHLRVGGYLKHC